MKIQLDTAGVESGIHALRRIADGLKSRHWAGNATSLAQFSNAGGLDEAGERLSPIGDERAPEANQAIALYLKHTADNLWLALTNTQQTDESFSGMMGSLLAPLGKPAAALTPLYSQGFQQLKAADPKTNTFNNAAVVTASESSLLGADMKLSATNTPLAYLASDFWYSNARLIADAMEALNGVQHALSSSADTIWIEKAMKKVTQIQNAGLEYVANSFSLANHTQALGMAADSERMFAAASAAAYAAAIHPAAKKMIEAQYLASYPARVTAGLVPAIPIFNRLLPDAGSVPSTPYASTDVPAPAETSYTPTELPRGLRDVLASRGFADLAHAKSPAEVIQQYGRPTPETFERIAAGAAPTQSASAVLAPPAPPAAGSLPTGGSAAPVTSLTPTANGGTGAVGLPASGISAPGSGAAPGTGAAGVGLAPGSGPAGSRGVGAAQGHGAGAGAANGARPGVGSGRGAGAGAGAGTGFGSAGSAAGNRRAGSLGANGMRPGGNGAGFGGGTGSAFGNAGASSSYAATGAAGNQNANGARGGAVAAGPMAAGANRCRGRDKSGSKVRTVTSAVERDGNLKALLGDAPLLLPAVIGHNVRG